MCLHCGEARSAPRTFEGKAEAVAHRRSGGPPRNAKPQPEEVCWDMRTLNDALNNLVAQVSTSASYSWRETYRTRQRRVKVFVYGSGERGPLERLSALSESSISLGGSGTGNGPVCANSAWQLASAGASDRDTAFTDTYTSSILHNQLTCL
ncbi:hypothetical protein AAFF_G00035640 [Aldrovandia affinis]|uniref:Uncharacterized protein n=1 Tax=Aldrovandia affinis TaxID=143900 RepID=A0AAD7S374_9TELE|nr:hypothetical protein AAFF_G00035640 [Aldrovandia affinis]